MNHRTKLQALLEKSEWTTEERQYVLNYLENSDGNELKELMQNHFSGNLENHKKEMHPAISEMLLNRIHHTISAGKTQQKAKRVYLWKHRMVAACMLGLLLSLSTYLVIKNKAKQSLAQTNSNNNSSKNDIKPGGNKAVLTLADGSTISLDNAANGTLTRQGNTRVLKLNNGQLAYSLVNKQPKEVLYNTISTPRGGQYQLMLSDGSQVWLNAASSIRFPVVFTGNERDVEITGEAYFEVAKNKAMPFKVKANSSVIEVLGTHFNVNAYNDEASIKTTLLEGSVKVSAPAASAKDQSIKFLQPGQQSSVDKTGIITVLDNADTEEATAWLHGNFQFRSADLRTILRQISRWYDVDVVYKGNVNLHFTGQLTKNENVSKIFEKLALTGEVHFTIDGKTIVVSS